MNFQSDPGIISWRMHLASPPEKVHWMVSTDQGRSKFWAESAEEQGGKIYFHFPNGYMYQGEILENHPGEVFSLRYFGSQVTFRFTGDGSGGTILSLTDAGVPDEDRCEVTAGWVSVLLALKAAVDHGVDLRNHDPLRTWDQDYVEN